MTTASNPTETVALRDKWIKRLTQEQKAHEKWYKLAKRADRMFFNRDEDDSGSDRGNVQFNLFWPTVKVTHGRIFSQPPKPDVRKRFQDVPGQQPVTNILNVGVAAVQGYAGASTAGAAALPQTGGNIPAGQSMGQPGFPGAGLPSPAGGSPVPAQVPVVDDNKIALTLERGITYTIDTTEFDADSHAAVNDLLVAGLGIGKIELDIQTKPIPVTNPVDGSPVNKIDDDGNPVLDEDGDPIPEMQEVIMDQGLRYRHFSWSQFGWEPQQHWSQVSWVSFRHWMTKEEIEEQFNVEITGSDQSNNTYRSTMNRDNKPQSDKYKDQFVVHEVWDKKTRTQLFVTDGYQDVLEVRPDPLGLRDFFPCPKPMMLNIKGDDLVPRPDYSYCEALFTYVEKVTQRITRMTNQVKDIGFYDASFNELLSKLTASNDGDLIPIEGMNARVAQLGGTGGKNLYDSVVAKQDNVAKVEVIQELIQLRELYKQAIYEIYGISDIQRGSTDPEETATAQNIKSEWANVRVGERIRLVALHFRDVFRIMAEILAEKFPAEHLAKITGIQLSPQEQAVLRSDLGRCYAVDVESDSTVVQDESAEKQNRLEFLNTVSTFLQQLLPAIQKNLIPASLGKEMLLFVINTFKSGRQLEDAVNSLPETTQQLGQLQQQLQQAQEQAQQSAQQLQKINMGKEQRENVKTSVDAGKTAADTEHTQVETAALAQDIAHKSMSPHPGLALVPSQVA